MNRIPLSTPLLSIRESISIQLRREIAFILASALNAPAEATMRSQLGPDGLELGLTLVSLAR